MTPFTFDPLQLINVLSCVLLNVISKSTMITNIRSPLLRALAQAQTRSLSSSAASVKFEERVAVVTGAGGGKSPAH